VIGRSYRATASDDAEVALNALDAGGVRVLRKSFGNELLFDQDYTGQRHCPANVAGWKRLRNWSLGQLRRRAVNECRCAVDQQSPGGSALAPPNRRH
jgi:hypothetical protein